jgi:hypothetical protein
VNLNLQVAVISAALCTFAAAPVCAVDAKYFEKQSCKELAEELASLRKAETVINDAIKKKDSEANIKTAVGFVLTGWPFWGKADHGNANAQLTEIRDDIRYVRAAQKGNKCAA